MIDELNKEQIKKDIEEWANVIRLCMLAQTEIYKKMNVVYKEVSK
jgi:hypothetical protein